MDPPTKEDANTSLVPSSSAVVAPGVKLSGPQRYPIRGVTVDFPYPAYECQQVYMEKVIQAVQLSQHALLESPTGTAAAYGHESLLSPPPAVRAASSSFAIPSGDLTASVDGLRGLYGLDRDITIGGDIAASSASGALMNAQPAQQSVNSLTNSLASAFGSTNTPSRPKIIYASRTHSQLAKVASELKQTVYRPKMTILGSRQQLCVHPVVSKLEGAGQTHACRALTSEKACNFYEHLPTWTAENQHLQNAVLDIEDLMSMGREQHMCPYFYSRDRMAEAELVLLPYNYLIDPTIRSRLGLKFENSVLIFDEAHNLEGVCGDSASFDLSAADLAAAIQEVQKCIDTIRDPTLAAFVMDGSSTAGNDIPDLQSLAILKAILLEFEGLLDKQPLPDSGDGLTQPGEFIFQLLAQCKIQQENKDMLLELLDKSVTLLFADRGQDAQRKSCALDKFASAIKIIFKGGASQCVASSSYYRVHIHTKEPPRPGPSSSRSKALFASDGVASKRHADVGRILSYWCFNPGIAMQDLTQVGIRCMILTSGTLSPMESFAHELKLPFPIRLENPHVIQPEQIWVGILERGPASQILNSGFKQRENAEYIADLGNAIVNFSRVVPDGLLVFFPSYSSLASCHAAWKISPGPGKPSIVDRIEKHKALVVEPRTSAEFPAAIKDFESKLSDPSYTGAVFFAVCRGKVSEGLDFADRAGRAVIVTGLPYPAFKDPKVRLKRQYLDESARIPGLKQLTGTEWYGQQAARAVNQAIGRVIRHRGDYGAIILADGRFGQSSVRAQLSRWIRPFVQNYSNFGTFAGGLQKFFKHAIVAYPESQQPREKKDGAEEGKRRGQEGHDSIVRQAKELERVSKAWSVSAITAPTTNLPTIKQSAKQSDVDWNASYAALTDGLTSNEPSPPPIPMSHVNPTLIKKHATSTLLDLLKPASTTTQTHGTTMVKSNIKPPTASGSSTSRLLKLSSLSSSASVTAPSHLPVKIELEPSSTGSTGHTGSSVGGSFSDYLVTSTPPVKAEPRASQSANTRTMSAVRTPTSTPPSSTQPIAAAKPASAVIKETIARVKGSLTVENFNRFKTTLQKLSELKSSTPTSDTFFQHVAAIHATVQMMASLLFGFDQNVVTLPSPPPPNSTSPLDSSIALAFEPHIPVPFRPQYVKAVETILARYPRAATLPTVMTQTTPTVQATQLKSEPSSTSNSTNVQSRLKREFDSVGAGSSNSNVVTSNSSSSSLPPPRTQQEFVGRVKAKLSQSNYETFKSIIIELEQTMTPPPPPHGSTSDIPPNLLRLFQRLQRVLESDELLRAYGMLIPQRLRNIFQQYLSHRSAVMTLKWTGAIDVEAEEDDDAAGDRDHQRASNKKPRLANNSNPAEQRPPIFQQKTIVRPQ